MTEKQMIEIAKIEIARKVALKYKDASEINRSDVIREVVRTRTLPLEDSLSLADCIIKGFYAAGKTVVL